MNTVHINLEVIEHLIYQGNVDEAASELMEVLAKVRQGGEFIGHAVSDPLVKLQTYTRLATAIAHLFANPQFQLSDDGFDKLAVHHASFSAIFENSVFANADFIAPGLTDNPIERDPAKFQFGDMRNLAKFLLLYMLNSKVDMNFEQLCEKAPQRILPLYIGMLTNPVVLTQRAHDRRERLLELAHHFKDVSIPDTLIPFLGDAFMYCSYGTGPDKHLFKKVMSAQLRKNLLQRGVAELTSKQVRSLRTLRWKDCQTVVIPIEWMNTGHAMNRCYAPALLALKEAFTTVAYVKRKHIDDEALKLFSDVIYMPEEDVTLNELAKTIIAREPDVIWYPSIGMAPWWVALAQLRLAPIQCASLGHPSSSFSSQIDYMFLVDGAAPNPSLLSEIAVELPPESVQYVERLDYRVEAPTYDPIAPRDGYMRVVKVAIPAMVTKLNVPFLNALKIISTHCENSFDTMVEYHFFPNVLGATYWQASKLLKEWFSWCHIHPRASYEDYIKILQQCHLHFNTFPFGGTNSNVDSFLSGIPVLALHGDEPHAANDRLMLERAGISELSADTEGDYITQAIRLIDPADTLRERMAMCLRETSQRNLFFGNREDAFVPAMKHILAYHEEIQAGKVSSNYRNEVI